MKVKKVGNNRIYRSRPLEIGLSIGVYPDTFDFDLTANSIRLGFVVGIPGPLSFVISDIHNSANLLINSLVNQTPTLNVTVNGSGAASCTLTITDDNGDVWITTLTIREM